MKAFLSGCFCLFLLIEISGQVKGNYSRGQESTVAQQSRYYNTLQDIATPTRGKTGFINDSTFELQTRLLMNVKADFYIAILSLKQAGKTAKICNQAAEARISAFKKALTSKNIIRPEDIYVDFIAQVPTYAYQIEKKIFSKSANEVPTGFELSKNIHIRFTKSEQLDQVILEAAEQEIYELVKVDYALEPEHLNQVYDSLRGLAVELSQKKIADLTMLGMAFSGDDVRYQTVKENLGSSYPVEHYESYSAYRSAQLPQSDYKETTRATKVKTYFYEKIPFNSYDLVINTDVLEPAVQFSYELRMRYVLNKRQ